MSDKWLGSWGGPTGRGPRFGRRRRDVSPAPGQLLRHTFRFSTRPSQSFTFAESQQIPATTMVKLKEIHRPSTFAWSPLPSLPLLATGTVAGALDESFSNNGQLEIWSPNFLDRNEYDLGGEGQTEPLASITTSSR